MYDYGTSRYGVVAATLLLVMQTQGCASALTEQEKYEFADRRLERIDNIRRYIAACQSSGRAVMFRNTVGYSFRDPVKTIPDHARLSHYQCVGPEDWPDQSSF